MTLSHEANPLHANDTERGSVALLIIGMTACLLLLGLGVTAAGSAFSDHQGLQHLCDGAASAASDALNPTATTGQQDTAAQAATDYLTHHGGTTTPSAIVGTDNTVTITCTNPAATISFGWIVNHPTISITTNAKSRPQWATG